MKRHIYEISDRGRTIGYLPGFIIYKGPIRIFASPFEGWNTPYLGPLFLGKVSDAVILEALQERFNKDKLHFAQFTYPRKIAGSDCGKFRITEGYTYLAEVAQSPEMVLKNYSKSTRKHVRRAVGRGLKAEFTNDRQFIDTYYEQLRQVFLKSNMRPTYAKAKVEALWDNLMPSGKLRATQVLYDNKIIATRLDFFEKRLMHSFGSASDQDYLHLNPNELARYHIMSFAAENEIEYYDMTGGGTYKEKFGAEKVKIVKLVWDPYGMSRVKDFAKKMVRLWFKITK